MTYYHPRVQQGNILIASSIPPHYGGPAQEIHWGGYGKLRRAFYPSEYNPPALILEAPFTFEQGKMTLEGLFADKRVLSFNVLKVRDAAILGPYLDPDPYTDEAKVRLSFDDIMLLFIACS